MHQLNLEDKGFLILSVSLFALVMLYISTGFLSFLFQSYIEETSTFAILSSASILFYFIFWGFIKLVKSQIRGKRIGIRELMHILFTKTVSLIGLRKLTTKASTYIVLCLFVGIFFNLFMLGFSSWLGIGKLYRVVGQSPYNYLSILVVPPIFEELIYRGLYLGMFLKLFGKKPMYAGIGLVMSAFTFGYIHPNLPLFKVVGAFLLGFVYLFGWKKNIIASSATHFGLNLVGIFITL
jgi:membrane protease YdiL (CAAX protease family)